MLDVGVWVLAGLAAAMAALVAWAWWSESDTDPYFQGSDEEDDDDFAW